MTLKLSKLPSRTPVKITATFPPEVHEALVDYALIYEQIHGQKEKIEELVPYMIAVFLDADKGFQNARKQLTATQSNPTTYQSIGTFSEGDQ